MNEGSQQKLFTTEATARYGNLHAPRTASSPKFLHENPVSQGFMHGNLGQVGTSGTQFPTWML